MSDMAGSVNDLGRKLRAVIPRIDDERRRGANRRDRWYIGIGLTSEARAGAVGAAVGDGDDGGGVERY